MGKEYTSQVKHTLSLSVTEIRDLRSRAPSVPMRAPPSVLTCDPADGASHTLLMGTRAKLLLSGKNVQFPLVPLM